MIGKSRKAGTPVGQQLARAAKAGLPARTRSLCSFTFSRAQGCRIGFDRSAMGKVGWAPLLRKSSLVPPRCAGSSITGPGPLGGGRKVRESATQPTPGLGAKSGRGASAASEAESAAPLKQTINVEAILDIM